MTRIIRWPKSLLAVLAAVLVLAGCGSGPSQVGSAAIVGDRAISVGQVRGELQWLLDNVPKVRKLQESGKLAQVSRRIVRDRVVHELVSVAARKAGVRLDQGKVAELIDSSGGAKAAAKSVGVSPRRVQQLAADQILLQELGKHYLPRLSVSFVGTSITAEGPSQTAEEKALDLAHRIAAHPRRAEKLTGATGKQVSTSELTLREAVRQAPGLATSAVFGAEPGTVLVIQPKQGRSGWLVAMVTERSVDSSGSGTQPEQANQRLLYQVGMRMLQPVASRLGVQINPRYGVWDATTLSIAPSEEKVAGHQLRSRTVRP